LRKGKLNYPMETLLRDIGQHFASMNTICALSRVSTTYITEKTRRWNNYLWLTRKDNELFFNHLAERGHKPQLNLNTLVLNALQKDDMKWLGNVPLDKINSLREN
jgi:hypothetical protein